MGILAKEWRQFWYRRIKYILRRAKPPVYAPGFKGPVVVVGSAPVSHKPQDIPGGYTYISVNGSQAVLKRWGIEAPDVTLMQFNQIEGTTPNAYEVRRVLNGERTGRLYILLWRNGMQRLKQGLAAFDFRYDDVEIVDRYQRIALMEKVTGVMNFELGADTKCSNGIIAILFALNSGATSVIITGINPNSSGHAYNQENLTRLHTDKDRQMLDLLIGQGFAVYTADPEVSLATGIPLWAGVSKQP